MTLPERFLARPFAHRALHDLSDGRPENSREAIRAADFASVRGDFKFGANHHPIHDIYAQKVVERDGVYTNEVISKVVDDMVDSHAADCKM